MRFDNNLAAIHGYLCADGYVIKNPEKQKHKYYYIGLRNTNETLLKDFQAKFSKVFGITPIITKDGRCKAQSKEIFLKLTKNQSFYSYEWKMPKLSKPQLKIWLRAFFDCEGWVEVQRAKSRSVRADCVNLSGLKQVKSALNKFDIKSSINKRKRAIWRMNICGLDNIQKFSDKIGFLHPDKKKLLEEAIRSYKNYNWNLSHEKKELIHFVKERGKIRASRNELRLFSIKQENLKHLKNEFDKMQISSKIQGPWKSNNGSIYYCLILKLTDVRKLEDKYGTSHTDQKDK